MKKFIFGLIMAMLCLIGAGTVTSCDNVKKELSKTAIDSSMVCGIVDKYNNPDFLDAVEFCNYADEEISYYDFVSTCRYMHRNTIEIIANICIKNYGHVDYLLFMQEFHDNEDLYLNTDKVNWKNDHVVLKPKPVAEIEKIIPLDSVTTTKEGV